MSPTTIRRIMIAWLAAVAAVVAASLLPAAAPPGAWGFDKFVHLAVFLVLAAVPAAVLPRRLALWWGGVSLLAVGLGIELAQTIVPGRVGSMGDFLADGLGVLAGVAAGRRVWRRLRPENSCVTSTKNAALDPQGQGK